MPRKARIDAPGALHHVIARGIDRKTIFKSSQDYSNFLKRLGTVLSETKTPCFAWALMTSHFHLLLRTGSTPISTVMRRLLTGYAQQFNRSHKRRGHLFQNRYKSILCQEDPYLLELVRYIHLNPLRAGIIKKIDSLKSYPYSGHSVIMGSQKYTWQDTKYVLNLFSDKLGPAKRRYAAFVAKGVEMGKRPELTGGGLVRSAGGWLALKTFRSKSSRMMGDERILGGSDFVESTLKQANEEYERKTFAVAKEIDLDNIINRVSEYTRQDKDLITGPGRQSKVSQARAIISFLGATYLGISSREISHNLGLSPSAVSKLIARGRLDDRSKDIWKDIIGEK